MKKVFSVGWLLAMCLLGLYLFIHIAGWKVFIGVLWCFVVAGMTIWSIDTLNEGGKNDGRKKTQEG